MLGMQTIRLSAKRQLVLRFRGQDWQLCTRDDRQTPEQQPRTLPAVDCVDM